MLRKIIPFAAISFVFILSLSAVSQTVYVDVDGPNDPGSGSPQDPFRRIQDGMDAAVSGDTIEIQPGLYTGAGNYDLDPGGKSIVIRSIDDPNAAIDTIIDPNGMGRGFWFVSGEDPNCVLSGLTIRNGYAFDDSGGGIYCISSSPSIMGCIIDNNTADLYGGGIYSHYEASPKIKQCIIKNNQAEYGGGFECSWGLPEISNCIIMNNHATVGGGGGNIYYECNPSLFNCVFVKNTAVTGGGVSCADSQVMIKNSILWGNQADRGSQIAMEYSISSNSAIISYSDLQGGQLAIYDPNNCAVWAGGNIDVDPRFVCFDPDANHKIWDFHLQSAYGRWDRNSRVWVADANTSPCIDAGDPLSRWSDELWPNGKRINMGAYGGTYQASKNGNPADFNVDNIVDLDDLLLISKQWMMGQSCIEDLNRDDDVDFKDFTVFAENWLWERP
jgi:hypothetical protein